jgi:hypothetical protein
MLPGVLEPSVQPPACPNNALTNSHATCRARLASEKERHDLEFNELLEAGKNPYEVARQKEVQASVKCQRRSIVQALRAGKDRITEQLIAEEQRWRKALAAQATDKVGHARRDTNLWMIR